MQNEENEDGAETISEGNTLEETVTENCEQKQSLKSLMATLTEKRQRDMYSKTPALQLLKQMLKKIVDKHHTYRESWEVLIEVLGQHLEITKQPNLYSIPSYDMEKVKELSPLHRAPFWVPKIDPVMNILSELFGLKPKPVYQTTDPHHPHYECYFDSQYRNRLRVLHQYQSRTTTAAREFVLKFRREGLLDNYVERARYEAYEGGPESCAGIDHLGAIFEEYELAGRKNRLGQMLTPMNVVKMITMMTFFDTFNQEVVTTLDPATGTGRFPLMTSLLNPQKPLIIHAVEIDVTMYRCCLINMALYSLHPYHIICADSIRLGPDTAFMWESMSNFWNPPDMTDYYYGGREIPHRHLSFEELMKRKAERLKAEKDLNIKTEQIIQQIEQAAKPKSSFLERYVAAKNKNKK